jgi:hypothetical protein
MSVKGSTLARAGWRHRLRTRCEAVGLGTKLQLLFDAIAAAKKSGSGAVLHYVPIGDGALDLAEVLVAPMARSSPLDAKGYAHTARSVAGPPRHSIQSPLLLNQPYLADPPLGFGLSRIPGWPTHAAGESLTIYLFDERSGPHIALPTIKPRPKGATTGPHGTATLGVLVAKQDPLGPLGICPNAHIIPSLASSFEHGLGALAWDVAERIARISADFTHGDLVLLELSARGGMPADRNPLCGMAIGLAVALGLHVVEAAGNGGVAAPPAPDDARTGALTVGSISPGLLDPTVRGKRVHRSTYGPDISIAGWDDEVVTTGVATGWGKFALDARVSPPYVGSYQGTSAASAQIAGCVAVLSSIAKRLVGSQVGLALTPADMHTVLSAQAGLTVTTQGDAPSLASSPGLLCPTRLPNLRHALEAMRVHLAKKLGVVAPAMNPALLTVPRAVLSHASVGLTPEEIDGCLGYEAGFARQALTGAGLMDLPAVQRALLIQNQGLAW